MKKLDEIRNTDSADFDCFEPSDLHVKRFESLVEKELHKKPIASFRWLGIAAVFIISIGISYLFIRPEQDLTATAHPMNEKNSFPLEEAEFFYSKTIESQFKIIAQSYQDDESVIMIEKSKELIKELEVEYKYLEVELSNTADLRVAEAMVLNYKSRISILETLIKQLKYVNQIKTPTNEDINA